MKKVLILIVLSLCITPWHLSAQQKPAELKKSEAPNLTDGNGNKYGYWTEKEGDITWKGEYVAGKKTKNWAGYYSNNYISKLEYYNNGVRDGILVQFDRKGKVTLVENYKNDKRNSYSFNPSFHSLTN